MLAVLADDFLKKLSFALKNSGSEFKTKDFAFQSLFVSAILSLFLFSLLLASSVHLFISLPAVLLFFLLLFFSILSMPFIRQKMLLGKIEAELPFLLLELSIQLNNGIILEKALKTLSLKTNVLSKELKKRVSGKSFLSAFNSLAVDFQSNSLNSTSMILNSLYSEGMKEKTDLLDDLASHLIERQGVQAKAYSGKAMLLTVLFVVVSAIIPSLFQAFVLVGSLALSLELTSFESFLIIVILFPLLDFALLALMYYSMPESIKKVRA